MAKDFLKNIFFAAVNLARFEPASRRDIEQKLLAAHRGKNPNYKKSDAVTEYNEAMQKTIKVTAGTGCIGIGLPFPIIMAEMVLQQAVIGSLSSGGEWHIIPTVIPALSMLGGFAATAYTGLMMAKSAHLKIFQNAGTKRVINRISRRTEKTLRTTHQNLLTQN